MNPIQFTPDEGTLFFKELTKNVDSYFKSNSISKKGNFKMYFKIVMYFVLVMLSYSSILIATSLVIFFLSYLVMGLAVLLTAFNVSHDAAHNVAVKNKRWNKFLFELSFNLQGNNAYVWGKNHNESHHLYTDIEGSDIDVLNNPLVRMTEAQERKWFHKYQYLYVPILYLLYSLNWFLFRELLMIFRKSSRTIKVDIPPVEIVKLVVFKIIYVTYMIVIPAMVTGFGFGFVMLMFILNHFMVSIVFTGVLGVSHLSDYVQHPEPDAHNKIAMSWPKLQMLTSVDYNVDSSLLNWTLGGFNAHALHHLFPSICHIHYPAIVPLLREVAQKHNIPYMEMSYGEALKSHFRLLKVMGTQSQFKTRTYES